MPGKAARGQKGFSPKEGVGFDWRLEVRMHSDERALLDTVRGSESRADFARAAIRRALLPQREFAAGLLMAAEWHESRAEAIERDVERARQWSIRNNDGNPDLGGTAYTVDAPIEIRLHRQAAAEFLVAASIAPTSDQSAERDLYDVLPVDPRPQTGE